MPRRKGGKQQGGQKRSGGKAANGLPHCSSDDEDRTPDNMSVASSQSDMCSIIVDGQDLEGDEVDDMSIQEDFEEKLKECIDGLTQKSAKGRTDCLKSLQAALSKKFMPDFVCDRKMTVQDSLERCLKKGKGEEQVYAAIGVALLFLQLGATEETEEAFKAIRPLLLTLMLDTSVSCKARAAIAQTLGLCMFITGGEREVMNEVMKSFERLFMGSYLKGDGSPPSNTPEVAAMHSAALNAWGLLLSISPSSVVSFYLDSHLKKLPQILTSGDVDLRITAGEIIALMYELGREEDEDFEGYDTDDLCLTLKQLATDSNKYRAKKDRRQQRSSFRDVLRAVEENDAPRLRIKFGTESVHLQTWAAKKQYDTFCNVLGSGMPVHLQENDLLREIFDLGPPIPAGAKPTHKPSRLERHLFNAAAFKARTKIRSKNRDKRMTNLSVD